MAASMCSYGIIDPASRRYFIVNAKPGHDDDVDQTVVLKPSATQLATIQASKDIRSVLYDDGPAYTNIFVKYTRNHESVATARFVDESQLTVGADHLPMLMAKFIGLLESRRANGLVEEQIDSGLRAVIVIGTNEDVDDDEEEEEDGDGDDDDDDDDDDDFVVAKHDDKLEKQIYSGLPEVIVIGRNEEEEVDDDDEDGDDDDEEGDGDGDGDDDDDDDDDDFVVAKHDDYESSEEEKEGFEEIEGEMCVICQEEYDECAVIGTLECGHGYHPKCIKKWLVKKNVCPICRFSL